MRDSATIHSAPRHENTKDEPATKNANTEVERKEKPKNEIRYLSQKTINNCLTVLRRMPSIARKRGLIARVPAMEGEVFTVGEQRYWLERYCRRAGLREMGCQLRFAKRAPGTSAATDVTERLAPA